MAYYSYSAVLQCIRIRTRAHVATLCMQPYVRYQPTSRPPRSSVRRHRRGEPRWRCRRHSAWALLNISTRSLAPHNMNTHAPWPRRGPTVRTVGSRAWFQVCVRVRAGLDRRWGQGVGQSRVPVLALVVGSSLQPGVHVPLALACGRR